MTTAFRRLSDDGLLLDYVRRLADHRGGRRAVLVRLSRLRPYNRRHHHLQMATNGFRALAADGEGQLFMPQSGDLVFVYHVELSDRVEAEVDNLRFLFADDPALCDPPLCDEAAGDGAIGGPRTNGDRGVSVETDAFVQHFPLEEDYDQFYRSVRNLVVYGTERAREEREPESGAMDREEIAPGQRQPLTPETLRKVEVALARAEVSSLVRRQSICAVSSSHEFEPHCSELYVSIANLREFLLPRFDFLADRWLFQRLTETLDRRVLALLSLADYSGAVPDLSLNLNVKTLLSRSFQRFRERMDPSAAGPFMIEVQAIDALSDPAAFRAANAGIHEQGCRVCLDGVDYRDLALFDRRRLGVDAVKVMWDPRLFVEDDATLERVRHAVSAAGPLGVILCRVDTRVAIDLGRSLGISLFQGRCMERLLHDDRRRRRWARLKEILIDDT